MRTKLPAARLFGWIVGISCLLSLLSPQAFTQGAPAALAAPTADPAALFRRALDEAAAKGIAPETISIHIELPGGVVLSHREQEPMLPASTMKLVTAAAALELLGPQHAFVTELWIRGEVRDGTLHGDVIVVGGGDPAPSSRRFPDDPLAELRPWVQALKDHGIERIAGDLVADSGYLAGPQRLEGWPQDQLHRWYCAPSGALNLNDNCVDLQIASSGDGVAVHLVPANPLFTVENSIRPTPDRDQHLYSVDRAIDSWTIRLGGRFLVGGGIRTEWITVPEPARAFLGAWRTLLRSSGIAVEGELRVELRGEGARAVARIEHRVVDVLPVLLKDSQNLYGDCLLRVTDRETGGDGSYRSAGETAMRYLISRTGGEGAVVRDGSGLSREDRLRCVDLVRLLRHADEATWGEVLWESLAVAGVDGTLSKRFRSGPLRGRLRGKTGHISGVSALAGGWESVQGPVRFAAFTGGPGSKVGPFRTWIDQLLEAVDATLGGPPPPREPSSESGGAAVGGL